MIGKYFSLALIVAFGDAIRLNQETTTDAAQCYTTEDGSQVCVGDSIGELSSGADAGEQHTVDSADALASKHMEDLDSNNDGGVTVEEIPDEYKNLLETIDASTGSDGSVSKDDLAAAYLDWNIHEKTGEKNSDDEEKNDDECMETSSGETICVGDNIGDLKSGADAGEAHTQESAAALVDKHWDEMNLDPNGDGGVDGDEVPEEYRNFGEAIDEMTGGDGFVTKDDMIAAYMTANIHEKTGEDGCGGSDSESGSGSGDDCFTGSNGETICHGDRIGDLQSNGGDQHSSESAYALADSHIGMMDKNGDDALDSDELGEDYSTMFEWADQATNGDGSLDKDELAAVYMDANIHEAE